MSRQLAFINGETLNAIRVMKSASKAYLERKVGLPEGRISLWESCPGDDYPTMRQAEKIAKVLGIPLAGLYLEPQNLPDMPLPATVNMRRLDGVGAIDDSAVNLAVSRLCGLRRHLIELCEALGESPTRIDLPVLERDPIAAADQLRCVLDLSVEEQKRLTSTRKLFKQIRSRLEARGIILAEFTGVPVEQCRGLALYFEEFSVAGVNKEDHYPAKSFSAIHEVGHLANRISTLCNQMIDMRTSSQEEVYCNALAGNFLVPEQTFKKDVAGLHDLSSMERIASLANDYCVSREVIARRLRDLGYLDNYTYESVIEELKKRIVEKKLEQQLERKEGRGQKAFMSQELVVVDAHGALYVDTVRRSVDSGNITELDACDYLGLAPDKLEKAFMEALR